MLGSVSIDRVGLSLAKQTARILPTILMSIPTYALSTCSLLMFQAMQARSHSPLTAVHPRSENRSNPITAVITPNAGSTVLLRIA